MTEVLAILATAAGELAAIDPVGCAVATLRIAGGLLGGVRSLTGRDALS